jgi:hypothetical protein
LNVSKIESPFKTAKREMTALEVLLNLSLLQNRQRPKNIYPKKIGITPRRYLRTFGRAFLIVWKIEE